MKKQTFDFNKTLFMCFFLLMGATEYVFANPTKNSVSCEEVFVLAENGEKKINFSKSELISAQDQALLQRFVHQQKQLAYQVLQNVGVSGLPDYMVSSLGTALDYFLSTQKFKTQRLASSRSALDERTSFELSVVQRNYETAIQYTGPTTTPANQLLFAQSIRDSNNDWNLLSKLPVYDRNEKSILLKSSDAELWLKIVLDPQVFETLLGESISLQLTPKDLHSIKLDLQRSLVLRHLVWRLIFDLQIEKAAQEIQNKFQNEKDLNLLAYHQMQLLASRLAVRRQFLAYLIKVKGFGSSRFIHAGHHYLDAYEISIRQQTLPQIQHYLKRHLDPLNRSDDSKLWRSFYKDWQNEVQTSSTHWSPFRWWTLLF